MALTLTNVRRPPPSTAFNAVPASTASKSSLLPALPNQVDRKHPRVLHSSRYHLHRTRQAPTMQVERVETGTIRNIIPRSGPSDQGHPVLVLNFITSNCRACKYASAGFARLAREFEERDTHRAARFLEVDVSNIRNQQLGQRLGVTAVPSFQLFAYKQQQQAPTSNSSLSSSQRYNNQNYNNSGSTSDQGQNGGAAGAFGILDELIGARVVGQVRDRLLHYCSDDFNLDDYVFDDTAA